MYCSVTRQVALGARDAGRRYIIIAGALRPTDVAGGSREYGSGADQHSTAEHSRAAQSGTAKQVPVAEPG